MRRATSAVLLSVLLMGMLTLQLGVEVVSADIYYFNLDIAVEPESPSTHDNVGVTVSFETPYIYFYPANFSEVSQSENNFSIIIEIYPADTLPPVTDYEKETYNLGTLPVGLYQFSVDVQVWSAPPDEPFRMLLESESYSQSFTVAALTITVPNDYLTIQEAINTANDGDTIFVKNGTYYENVVVNKSVSLVGEDKETTIVDGSGTRAVVRIEADNVTITNFTLQNAYRDYCGILVRSSGNNISHNIIVNNGWGISIEYAYQMNFCRNTVAMNTVIDNIHSGITVEGSHNSVYGNNVIQNHQAGIYLGGTKNSIVENTLANNTWGVWIEGASDNTIRHNIITDNELGVYLLSGTSSNSSGNEFHHNNFIDNADQVSFWHVHPNSWDNGCEGNYWLEYNGTDADGDGIGDMPHVINENNTDLYPLITPFWNPGDIDHNLEVDIFDVVLCANAYGSTPADLNWNPHCDIAEPYGVINIFDIVMIATNYGEEYTP